MIATLTMSPTTDFRNSNTAGAPLPLLPRRSPSANRTTFTTLASTTPPKQTPPIRLVVQHATPPEDTAEASSSSSSSSDGRPTVSIRAKRVRGVRPPEQSTPTPVFALFPTQPSPPPPSPDVDATPRPARPLIYVPGTTTALRALSTSHLPPMSPSPPKATSAFADETPRMVRKKSGQPVKSSLKSTGPRVRGSLAVAIGTGAGSSKSAPTTPTQGTRSVHFDTQLEHVKLFLAEQKPLAVSRDGSPTDDTSGTEGDFPSWIYGGRGEAPGKLEMQVEVPPPPTELDVKLQALVLSEDGVSVTGTVAVRNMAFDKWVAVRFTFDDWQTTSEVTGRYSHSLPGGAVDVFAFTIRLNDLLARIEGKVMMLAVRYTSAGREMWDNNGGGNYRATFKRVRKEREPEREKEAKGPEGEVAADLRSRLERMVKGQESSARGPIQLRATNSKNAAESAAADKFKAGGSLAARYDFGTSSRNPWRSPHQRAQSHPVFDSPSPSVSPPSTIPWPTVGKLAPPKSKAGLGSPRDAADDTAFRPAPYVASDSEDAPFAVPVVSPPSGGSQRHHQRGYFDLPLRDAATLKRTPPGTPRHALDDLTPLGSPLGGSGRYSSFPPLDMRELEARLSVSASEESTPSVLSSAGSSRSGSDSASPVSPPDLVGLGLAMPVGSPATYHNFLDKFCFYTGPGVSGIEGLPRTQSVSSVEEFLSAATPRLQSYVQKQQQQQQQQVAPAPLRFDDSRSSDGSTTPTRTTSFPPVSESRSATPVAA